MVMVEEAVLHPDPVGDGAYTPEEEGQDDGKEEDEEVGVGGEEGDHGPPPIARAMPSGSQMQRKPMAIPVAILGSPSPIAVAHAIRNRPIANNCKEIKPLISPPSPSAW